MARVEAFSLPGVRMWFFSGDHDPPHFHAKRPGHWHVKVYVEEGHDEVIEMVRPPDATLKGRDRQAILDNVERHRAALLQEWEAAQAG